MISNKIIPIKEQQKLELDILIYVRNICIANNIKYSLCGGSLIGAVRHKGFIPWDDDIDIFMTRENYNKLLKILENSSQYEIKTFHNTKNYPYGFAKLMDCRTILHNTPKYECENLGVFIDIFPLDYVPDSKKEQDFFYQQVIRKMKKAFLASEILYKHSNTKLKCFIKNIIYLPLHLFYRKQGMNKLMLQVDEKSQQYNANKTNTIGSLFSRYKTVENLPKETYLNHVELEFEGECFSVIKEYDLFLKTVYGNYMELPPKEQQVLPHEYEAYWRE